MEKLRKVIGPAPSEMADVELEEKLRKERFRVTSALENFKATPKKSSSSSSPKTKTTAVAKKVIQACKELGITVEEFLELRAELEAEKKKEEKEG